MDFVRDYTLLFVLWFAHHPPWESLFSRTTSMEGDLKVSCFAAKNWIESINMCIFILNTFKYPLNNCKVMLCPINSHNFISVGAVYGLFPSQVLVVFLGLKLPTAGISGFLLCSFSKIFFFGAKIPNCAFVSFVKG